MLLDLGIQLKLNIVICSKEVNFDLIKFYNVILSLKKIFIK